MTDEVTNSVHSTMGRIEGKLDIMLPLLTNHEGRISSLEKSRAWMLGAAAVIVALLGAAVKVLSGWKA
jgi:hypothetical protein